MERFKKIFMEQRSGLLLYPSCDCMLYRSRHSVRSKRRYVVQSRTQCKRNCLHCRMSRHMRLSLLFDFKPIKYVAYLLCLSCVYVVYLLIQDDVHCQHHLLQSTAISAVARIYRNGSFIRAFLRIRIVFGNLKRLEAVAA